MPLYEYYCRICATKYDLLRPMSRSDEPGRCPRGHDGGARTLSMFATIAKGGEGASEWVAPPGGGGCACGGGACGCSH